MAQVRSSSDNVQLPAARRSRTAIGLLLLDSLVCGLALGLRPTSAPSSLQTRLKYVFRTYLQTLNFDFYDSRLSDPRLQPTDIDYTVEVTSKGGANGRPGPQ